MAASAGHSSTDDAQRSVRTNIKTDKPMGYTTEFDGVFSLDRPMNAAQIAYLRKFNQTRRMKRDAEKTKLRQDPFREAVELPIGVEGGYFVGADGEYGQEKPEDVIDYNHPPDGQPSLWCGWTISEDGTQIEWDGGEKFYEYIDWLKYLVENFIKPWGYKLNGEVEWSGEDRNDFGKIICKDNVVTSKQGMRSYK